MLWLFPAISQLQAWKCSVLFRVEAILAKSKCVCMGSLFPSISFPSILHGLPFHLLERSNPHCGVIAAAAVRVTSGDTPRIKPSRESKQLKENSCSVTFFSTPYGRCCYVSLRF